MMDHGMKEQAEPIFEREYTRKGRKETITIYQFDGERSLVWSSPMSSVMPWGWSSDDPKAVMYRLVRDDDSIDLSPDDVAALKPDAEAVDRTAGNTPSFSPT